MNRQKLPQAKVGIALSLATAFVVNAEKKPPSAIKPMNSASKNAQATYRRFQSLPARHSPNERDPFVER